MKSPFKFTATISGLTTYDSANYPVRNNVQETGSVAIPSRRTLNVNMDEVAQILADAEKMVLEFHPLWAKKS